MMIIAGKQTKLAVITLSMFFVAIAFAQTPKVTMADAQRAYVAGDWKKAATAYEAVCPTQPQETQVSCNLWGILALSQAGDAKSFRKAGTKLDSLINTTNPQHENYADLVMTRAQFMLYLGKYDRAAEDLIHAIETSKPEQNLVLQKVCTAVRSKSTSADLAERCESLKDTTRVIKQTTPSSASITTTPSSSSTTVSSSSVIASSSTMETAAVPSSAAIASSSSEALSILSSATQSATAAPSSANEVFDLPDINPAPQSSSSETYWVLQLGAFGVKSNANLLISNLKKHKISCSIEELPRGEKVLYMVQTGRFASREAANSYGEKTFVPLNVEYQAIIKK